MRGGTHATAANSTQKPQGQLCYDVNFCATCLDKAKTSSLEERYCNPHHSWFQAWPIQEDVEETICRSPGGSPGLTREWLDALRSEWLIE
ncbi:hypothetical protein DHEL01_v211437 [Diaporthe helianthi]|uniref:Uncharacterized protein n=1 Tax=Diaporthe helianthi TaxID=158607 RepID=A0A2P5HIU1_DIAHE|nr:hypothetical protein DHEL01_v211437 [Diaporthe helianthi]